MSLHDQLRESLKAAMKAKDSTALTTIRSVMTACTNELVATSRTPQDQLSDEEILAVIKRLAKQRKESIDQFRSLVLFLSVLLGSHRHTLQSQNLLL